MVEKEDWRLLNDVQHLSSQCIDPVDGEDIIEHLPKITKCQFCWDKIINDKKGRWYLPIDKSCCICEDCFNDFKIQFNWQLLDGWDIDW